MTDTHTAPQRNGFRYLERLRVRWVEVDMQRIVFNGHYLMYFDTAVAGYWRALALPYHETMARLDGDLYVRKATLEYEGSARYDDLLDVGIRCARIGKSSMLLQAAVFRAEQRLVHGDLVYVFADPATQTARPVPPVLRDVLLGFEAGASMIDVRVGDWATLGNDARAIRDAVFVQEQGIPAALEHDADDAQALHAVVFNRLGQAVATGRLPDEKKLFIRQADVFAAYVAYTDHEIGRVIQAVEDMGKLDNTLIIYIEGDNGTSAEGQMIGTPNEIAMFNGANPPVEMQLKYLYDVWGSDKTYNHMAVPWAWAFDTPFSWTSRSPPNSAACASRWPSPGRRRSRTRAGSATSSTT